MDNILTLGLQYIFCGYITGDCRSVGQRRNNTMKHCLAKTPTKHSQGTFFFSTKILQWLSVQDSLDIILRLRPQLINCHNKRNILRFLGRICKDEMYIFLKDVQQTFCGRNKGITPQVEAESFKPSPLEFQGGIVTRRIWL